MKITNKYHVIVVRFTPDERRILRKALAVSPDDSTRFLGTYGEFSHNLPETSLCETSVRQVILALAAFPGRPAARLRRALASLQFQNQNPS